MQLQDAAPQYIPCQPTVSLMCKVNFKPANAQSDKETHVCSMCVCACFCLQYRDLDNSKTIGTSVPDALRFECLLFAILVLPSGFVAMRLLLFLALQAESAAQQKSCPETLSIVGGTWFQQLVGIDSLLQEVAKEGRHTNITYQRFLWNALRDSDMFQLLWLD